MIAVDTNVVAYLLIEGDKTELAQETYRRDNEWIMPPLWRHEYLNVLSTFVRHGGGRREDGWALWQRGLALFGENEQEVDALAALDLSIEHNISAYDAQFVALALAIQSRLVTEDRRILSAFPEMTLSMSEFLAAGL